MSHFVSYGSINVPKLILRHWTIDNKNILNSIYSPTGEIIFKFSYQPESREFLCAPEPTNHASMILNYGKKKFNDYIRGIYFKEKKTVYLRGHANKNWLKDTNVMLRKYGVPQTIKIVWGPNATKSLSAELRGL